MLHRIVFICYLIGLANANVYASYHVDDTETVSFKDVYEYSKFKIDTASIILESKKEFIDFSELTNETAFEYFLAKADIPFRKSNYKVLNDVLASAIDFFQASENEVQKIRYKFYTYFIDESTKIGSRRIELKDIAIHADSLKESELWIEIQLLIYEIYENEGNKKAATDLLYQCIDKADENALLFTKGTLFQFLATQFVLESKYVKADSIFSEAVKIFEDLNYKHGVAAIFNNKGMLYEAKGLYNKSIRNFYQSIPILEKLNDQTTLAYVNNNIGLVYERQKDYTRSLKYFHTSLKKLLEIGDLKLASYVNNNIGVAHLNLAEYDKAEEYLLKSIEEKEKLNENRTLIYAYNKLGILYIKLSKYNEAKKVLQKAFALTKKIHMSPYESETLLALSMVHFQQGQLIKSEKYAQESLDLSTENENLSIQLKATLQLAEITGKLNDYRRSCFYFKDASVLKDSLYNVEKIKEIENLIFQYETNKKRLQQELNLQKLKTDNIQKDAIIYSNKKSLLLSGLLLLLSLITIGLGLKNSIQKRKTYAELSRVNGLLTENNDKLKHKQEVLEDINNNLINFAGTAAHDLKSPLRTISSLNGLLAQKYKEVIQPKDQKILDLIKGNIVSLNKMIEDLLVFSKIDQDLPAPTRIDLKEIVDSVKSLLKSQIDDKNGQIILHGSAFVLGHHAILVVLFQNIIQNALKFSAENRNPVIEITFTSTDKNKIEVSISDNGIGIQKSILNTIFKGFKKGHLQSEYEGFGIGLATCKKIVQHYKGEIKAESEVGKGTNINFSLPLYDEVQNH